MDRDHSLNASRPTWSNFAAQASGNRSLPILDKPWRDASGVDSSRPAWDESAPLAASHCSDNGNSASNKPLVRDEERVANDMVSHQDSRPVDFLKLVGLWTATNRRSEAVEGFRAEGSTSMGAAKTLGQGLSFKVLLVGVEDHTKQRLQLRSPFVVYKKLKHLTENLDLMERGALLRAVLLEVRVLTHPPLRTHNNIAKLLQLIWEPDPDLPDQAWPVLVMEHAENGTLADFQIDHPKLPFVLKKKLCRDVGHGLWALHSAGIVHGDLKSENVLIYDTDDGNKVVAKLADFGCAVTDLEPSDTLKLPAFSLPWNAPESHDRLPRDLLKYTDVYSYGLLIWRAVLDGANPFRHINTLALLDLAEFQRQVDILKIEDRVLPLAKSTLGSPFCSIDESRLVASVLNATLQLDASNRDLCRALELMRESSWAEPSPVEPLMQHEYEDVDISALAATVAPLYLQLSVIQELETLSTHPGWSVSSVNLKLFELYMERLEWPGAEDSAANWYTKVTEEDPTTSIARYAWGVFEFLQRPVPSEINPTAILKSFAGRGCYYSLMELRRRSPSDFAPALRDYRRRGGLLRRDEKHEIFDIFRFDDFEEYFDHLAKEENKGSRLGEILISKNDDLLLHAAARYGVNRAINYLLSLGIDINSTNRDGETALLQACRAGRLEAVEFLLEKGADPAIGAGNGETPLHWIFAFDEEDIESATSLLLSKGGEPCLYATVAVGHSSAVECLALYGTPLDYAILVRNETAARTLLYGGADPFIEHSHECADDTSPSTPFRLAIRELLPSIVKIMIGSATSAPNCRSFLASEGGSILHYAVESSSKAIRRVALGGEYVSALIETIDLLRSAERKEKHLELSMSLLHACIVHGIPVEVIEHLLQTGCWEDLELVSRPHGHTPLQVAMHLNRRKTFLLLLKYGADIHRRLQFPEGFSYLQFCAHLGPRAVFFAEELITRGAVLHELCDPQSLDDPKSLSRFAPGLLAALMGNFELATTLTKIGGSTRLVPRNVDIIWLMFRFFPRLPVSRLRYMLEPTEGFEAVALTGFDERGQRNCFHSLVGHPFQGEDEVLVNFRYLLQQSKRQNQSELLDQQDRTGLTPLLLAVSFGRLKLVLEMLSAGANPNIGLMPCVNVARLFLMRLRKTPTQHFSPLGGTSLSRMEARWRQEDYNSIIMVLKQYGGTETEMTVSTTANFLWRLHSAPLKVGQQTWKESYKKGKEIGEETISQHGYWGLLQLLCDRKRVEDKLSSNDIMHGLGELSMNPFAFATKSLEVSRSRYQSDLAVRQRFSTDDGSKRVELGGLRGKLDYMKEFAKWFATIHPPEIEDTKPQVQPDMHQGAYPVAGAWDPFSEARVPGTVLHPISNVPPRNHSPPSGFSRTYPERHPPPVQQATVNRAHSGSQQMPRAQTPEFHVHILSQKLSPILSSSVSDPGKVRSNIQECLDRYFSQQGASALTQDADLSRGAPLGSLPVLELENGIDHLLRGRYEVIMMKRDAILRAIVCDSGEKTSARAELAQAFVEVGWMSWQQLEEMEADILTRSFEAE